MWFLIFNFIEEIPTYKRYPLVRFTELKILNPIYHIIPGGISEEESVMYLPLTSALLYDHSSGS